MREIVTADKPKRPKPIDEVEVKHCFCKRCNSALKLQELVKEEIKKNKTILFKLSKTNGFYDEIRIVNQNFQSLVEESEK